MKDQFMGFMRVVALIASVAWTCAGQTPTTPAAATDKETRWTVEDMIAVERGQQFRIAPDG